MSLNSSLDVNLAFPAPILFSSVTTTRQLTRCSGLRTWQLAHIAAHLPGYLDGSTQTALSVTAKQSISSQV
jgi:hypothetical protein